jgi:hypothetical protein
MALDGNCDGDGIVEWSVSVSFAAMACKREEFLFFEDEETMLQLLLLLLLFLL